MKFYVVNNNAFEANGFVYGEDFGDINRGNAVKCEKCGSFLTSLEWLPPLEIKISRGKIGDVIFGTYPHFVVSEKFKEIYEKNGFKGILSFEVVTMFRKKEKVPEKYYYPKIPLSQLHVDLEKSGVILDGTRECSACQKAGRLLKRVIGVYLENVETNEDDIFCTKVLPGDIVCSQRFKEATKDLTNLSFIDAEKYVPIWSR